ncbi:MAG: phosphatidate cytidylyltransferase [Paludibacteraceae bacterium]|nr:phosphatidate cytidylyltransferase [Paludibacteraceae bacterium]
MIKNLITRFLSGALFVAVMIGCIWMSDFYFGALFLLLVIFGLREFYALINKEENVSVLVPLSVVGGALLFSTVFYVFFYGGNEAWLILDFIYVSIIMIVELFRNKKNPLLNMALSLLGILYVALPFSLMAIVESRSPFGVNLLIAFFIIIWASDTGAYLSGVCFGKHKMFERISPKKTWEGLFGGFLFTVLIATIFYYTNYLPFTWISWVSISVMIFAFGVLGDLVESMMKRSLGVKDSGVFLPGHGGLLDRFDSALMAAPALCMVAFLLVNC